MKFFLHPTGLFKATPFEFIFSKSDLLTRTFLGDLATMSSFIDSTNVTRWWWWKVHKRWSSLKSGVKKRIHSKKVYLLWAILELWALCEGAAAAKSDQKSVNLQNSHKSQYFKGHFLSMMIFHAK